MKDALGAVQSVLVLGGTSEIGLAIAAKLAVPRRATVVLAGRDAGGLAIAADSLRAAGAGRVATVAFDADQPAGHDDVIADAVKEVGGDLDVVVLAFGLLGDQAADEAGGDGAWRLATTNYVGGVTAGLAAGRRLRTQGHGALVVLSSVAGERVRRANFVYGSSKAGLDGFALGLGDALAGTGARVLVVRPGFVRTKMTAGLDSPPLSTTPEAVADATVVALARGREVIWVPAAMRPLFTVFRHLPRVVWRRIPM
jgi:decaprenylphospho-beta-D-erythro-pentofuranosid-2-ulose 2-reductase